MEKDEQESKEQLKDEFIGDKIVEYQTYEVANTAGCDHEYILDPVQDPNSNLLSAKCIKCPHGHMIDENQFEIKEGKIVTK